ncbi:HAD-IB family hydrolase [Clostridium fallax]|uniref:HAD-superfamily subfamily IB hydrolase, TIGR01490 n=1 Tax=Clostridium fallax TaxID=1533 RepID=A0A1M4UND1_9CLOT|nr:HAD-IB family hydrolase [Clostridium fallax]SHE58090.1 HAD-superfamily subfamily IB hydrolase, TIGR01490 [Clostridium fallax]SQB07653.1 HAD family hydrolase [Clostridium fallax]
MEKLAIFDVDFTLTKKETLMEFYKFMIRKDIKNIRFLPRAAFSGIMFILKIFDERKTKETFLKFIDKIDEDKLKEIVKDYYEKVLSKIFYKDGVDMIKKLKSEGYKIYLISASPEFYLKELYNIKEVDKVIGTKFRFNDNKVFLRKIDGENCKGKEKVRRLMEELKKENIKVDFKDSYMFSDSLSDKPLFDLVGHPYLINYRGKNNLIKILKWN